VEKVFRFARDARENFHKCSPEEKKRILLVIGSNLQLRDRKLLIDSRKPFQLVQDGANQTRELLTTFETVDDDFHKAKSPFTGALSTVWSPILRAIRTYYEEEWDGWIVPELAT
jgi:hypothetical protein